MSMRTFTNLSFGSDPEFFFKDKDGNIIGSERVIPEGKLLIEHDASKGGDERDGSDTTTNGKVSSIVLDGVQVEFNPIPNGCRANFQNTLRTIFKALKAHMDKHHPDKSLTFEQVVQIKQEELDSLSEKCRTFGCMPSYNIYSKDMIPIGKNPATYLYRSAGGHIHLGLKFKFSDDVAVLKDYERIIKCMDVIVGNTCVLLDRHPLTAERRTTYGRAGEYRKPEYGVEYRTLSNFWLRNNVLVGLVLGLSKIAVSFATSTNSDGKKQYYDELMALISEEDIVNAINLNDYDLALKNFNKIKEFVANSINEYDDLPLTQPNLPLFEHFISKGIDYWFPKDDESIMNHWITLKECHDKGFENFLHTRVLNDKAMD